MSSCTTWVKTASTGLIGAVLATSAPTANDATPRTIAFYNIHTKETLSIVYKRRGQYQPGAMKRINWVLRDWRRNKPTKMDPKLIDLAWEMHKELGSREPIHVISGYRSPKTNAMLRRTRGGQARQSQHLLGRALDMRFPDVPIRRLRYAGLIRERGGIGYYPTSGTPFVHIDTGRVRHWPRMGRSELALLFPNGRTRHRPRRGGAITRRDAVAARRRFPKLATQVASYHRDRRDGRPQTIVASLGAAPVSPFRTTVNRIEPPPPSLVAPPPRLRTMPRLVDRPSRLVLGPSLADRQALTRLAAFASRPDRAASGVTSQTLSPAAAAPRPARQTGSLDKEGAGLAMDRGRTEPGQNAAQPTAWVSAPSYDEEHPEEMSYRPFPILPFLTATASPHDPALTKLVHPDASRTLELLDQEGSVPPMRLRPGIRTARVWWGKSFQGKAVDLGTLTAPQPAPSRFEQRRSPLRKRAVTTSR